ncbi:hypothetical protein GOODEAATRI_000413 [Goodea atripinnis]|uniref:Uncharacterized protein n=1 Tax=Goodea atripinnis TaxID=208336 RepID=A0ABV0MXK1_9TELE
MHSISSSHDFDSDQYLPPRGERIAPLQLDSTTVIAFGFLRCWGVFGSLSHFRQSSGAVPPWVPCRWAHVWRNEPRAIILISRPPQSLCLSLTSPCFLFTSLPNVWPLHLLYLSLSPLCASFHSSLLPVAPPPPVSWGCRGTSACTGSTGGPAKRNHRDAAAHLRLVLPENLPVHGLPCSQTCKWRHHGGWMGSLGFVWLNLLRLHRKHSVSEQ